MNIGTQIRRIRTGREVRLSRSKAGTFFIFLFLALLCAFMFLPVLYAILQSVKPIEEYYIFPPRFFVQNPTFQNYSNIMLLADNLWVPFSRYVLNTLIVTVCGTVIYVLLSIMAGYSLAKSGMRWMSAIVFLMVVGMLFNSNAVYLVQYLVVLKLGLIDTYPAMILPMIATTMGVFLMRQFISSNISDEMLEAARIDGAGEFTILFKIVTPGVKAGWLTITIFQFLAFWNNANSAFTFSENLKQVPAVIGSIATGSLARAGSGSAVVVISMIPPLIVFIWSQRSIMDTMAHSGLK